MTMTFQKKILEFLKAKDYVIHKVTKLHYIYVKDLEFIKALTDTQAEDIWTIIKLSIYQKKKFERTAGLCSAACPWCISKNLEIIDGCEECTYAKNHGKCYTSKVKDKYYASHYDRIKWTFKDAHIDHEEILSNKWYRETVERIELKDKLISEYGHMIMRYVEEDGLYYFESKMFEYTTEHVPGKYSARSYSPMIVIATEFVPELATPWTDITLADCQSGNIVGFLIESNVLHILDQAYTIPLTIMAKNRSVNHMISVVNHSSEVN